MKRPDDHRLWARVAATVHPLAGRVAPVIDPQDVPAAPVQTPLPVKNPPKARAAYAPPTDIEPNRLRRIVREPMEARIDLHGMDQDRARAALEGFLLRAWSEGYRAALIITGKGTRGEGVLRKRTPEWLAAPNLRDIVAGVSEAHRHHGGEGALYVALKRRPKP